MSGRATLPVTHGTRLAERNSPGPRIVVAHLSVGSGHRMAAEAVAAALGHLCDSAEVRVLDLTDALGSWRLRHLPEAYGAALRFAPWAYDWCWRHGTPTLLGRLCNSTKLLGRFGRLLQEARADAVVCTHALAARLSARLRQAGMDFVNAFILTDFGCHRFWPRAWMDLVLAPSQDAAGQLVSAGVPACRVQASGIPLRPAFWSVPVPARPSGRGSEARGARAVVMAGSTQRSLYRAAAEAARALVRAQAQGPLACDLTVVTGRDELLRRELCSMAAYPDCRVVGYVDDMPGLLQNADVLAAKPGGLATAEALACGVPLLYVGTAAGQERANVEFAFRRGAALHAADPAQAPSVLASVLARPDQLRRMAERARELGRPRAALDAASRVLAALRARPVVLRGETRDESSAVASASPGREIGAAQP